MSYRSRLLVEEFAAGLGHSVADVWETLESLRLAWRTIGQLPCAEIDDLCDELDLQTLAAVADLLAQAELPERCAA